MNLIQQKWSHDCGVAVAAMLARKDYDTACILTSYQAIRRGLSVSDMLQCLADLGSPSWRVSKRGYKKPLIAYDTIPHDFHALIIRRPGDSFGHWIARHGNTIFDPEKPTPYEMSEYDRKAWEIIRIVAPT